MMEPLSTRSSWRPAANGFIEHHHASIRLQSACFDRLLLNAIMQPLQPPPVIVGFLDRYRRLPAITKA